MRQSLSRFRWPWHSETLLCTHLLHLSYSDFTKVPKLRKASIAKSSSSHPDLENQTRTTESSSSIIHESEQLEDSESIQRCNKESAPERSCSILRQTGAKLPGPTTIPWQVKVANSVHLIGTVRQPIQFDVSTDGEYRAMTVLAQGTKCDRPKLCIPITFEGELAQIAAFHISTNDFIYINGQLCERQPILLEEGESNIQVIVHNLNFVHSEKSASIIKNLQGPSEESGQVSGSATNLMRTKDEASWKDFIENFTLWCDKRMDKLNGLVHPKYPDFKHRETGHGIWLNSAPHWVLPEIEKLGVSIDQQNLSLKKMDYANSGKSKDEDSWKDFIANFDLWCDKRMDKLNGLVVSLPFSKLCTNIHYTSDIFVAHFYLTIQAHPKSPDFTHRETGHGIWLNSAPHWALPEIKKLGISMDESNLSLARMDSGQLWKSLIENPSKWWDNRFDKRNRRGPDFKHKDTGQCLWIGSSTPAWVHSRLPCTKYQV